MVKLRCWQIAFIAALALLLVQNAEAASSSFEVETISELYHITADRTLYHSREKVKEAFGHVVVSAEGKRLAADYLWVDDNTKDIKARGNVVFVDKQTTVEAAELHFNMNTGFGSIFYGRVYNDLYSLRGQLIRRVGDGHYLATEGEYSTCKDCPESWKLAARNVDLTVEGYAFMDGVFVKIKDIPTLYVPYLIVPVKTQRQTGLLFPRIAGSALNGFVFVQPLFVAIDKHQDLTVAAGRYSLRGNRYEGQYRYVTYNGIHGQTDVFYVRDAVYDSVAGQTSNRAALRSENEWPFFKHFGVRWRFNGSKDRDYTYDFPEDYSFQNLPAVESNVVAQAPFDDFFVSAEVRRYANLLYDDPLNFDTGMVQAAPTVHAGIKERKLVGPLLGSAYGRFDNFTRHNGPFYDANGNKIFDPSFDDPASPNPERLREARRLIFAPELSMPFSIGRYFSVIPSLQYNSVNYTFFVPPPNFPVADTSTNYLRAKFDVSTVVERVYDYDGEKISKVKHQLIPFVSASYIPSVENDPSHPFQKQVKISDGPFDQYDVVPLTNSTNFLRFPQGKSLYYGFNSRLVKKRKRPEDIPRAYPYDLIPPARPKTYPTPYNRKQELSIEAQRLWDQYDPRYDLYQEFWTFSASQAYDFLEAHDHASDPRRAFSYALAKSALNLDDNFIHGMEYRYYPALVTRPTNATSDLVYHDVQTFTNSLTWYWKRLQNLRRTRFFERSIAVHATLNGDGYPQAGRSVGGDLTWSFNDFASVHGKYEWDINARKQNEWAVNALLSHPSECWGLAFHWDWKRTRGDKVGDLGFQVLLNLDGSGFIGKKNGDNTGTSVFGGG